MEKVKSFPETIQSVEAAILDLTEELDSLTEIYNASVLARDNYYSALDELEKTKERFQQDVNGNIYTEDESNLNDSRSKLITERYSKEQVDNFILNTEIEIEELKEVIEKFKEFSERAKGIWNNLSKYIDVIDILNSDNSKVWLAKYLKEIEDNSEDVDKIEFLKFLRKGISLNNLDSQVAFNLSGAFKNAKTAFDKINNELFPKLQRLQQASEQLTEFSKLKDRVDFLKFIQDELFDEVNYIQERRRIEIESTSAMKAEIAKLNPNANVVEIVNGEDFFVSKDGVKRPLLSLTSLYLTTGKHYQDDDTTLNMESGNPRFFKFTENINVETGNYFLMPVTKANDTYGITFDENDIKVIVVKHENNEFKPVDTSGQIIENPNVDNIVYTSLRMNNDALFGNLETAVEWVESRFITKGLTTEQISNMIYKYRDFVTTIRNTISSNGEIFLPIARKTIGAQVMLPQGINGLPQELTLEGRLIEEKTPDYGNLRHPNGQAIELKVATDSSDGIKPGRLYMKREDGQVFRVFNRQLNEDEKDNFINLLKYLAKINQKEKVEKLNNVENANKEIILKYFKGLVFWTTEDNYSKSDNRFYINEKGMLYKGSKAYGLSESIIEENKKDIVSELRHQVNNSMLTESNTSFYAMTTDNEGNPIIDEKYSNYTEYLFKNSEPVVYTNVPKYDETDVTTPQVKNVNLVYINADDQFTPIVNIKDQETVILPGLGKAKLKVQLATTSNSNVVNTVAPATTVQTEKKPAKLLVQLATNEPETLTTPAAQPSVSSRLESIQNQNITAAPFAEEPVKQFTEEQKDKAAKSLNKINRSIFSGRKPNLNYRLQLNKKVTETEDFDKVVKWFESRLPNIKVVKVYELIDGKAWGAFKNGVVYIYENAEIGTAFHEAFEAVWNGYLTTQEQNELAEEFKNRDGKFTNPFTKETKDYSNASTYDVKEMLAEEFRSYILEETNDIESPYKTTFGKIKDFFKNLWNTIKKYIGISKKDKIEGDSLINNLFNKINKGNYSNVRFARSIEEMGTSYREVIKDTTQEFTTQFIDGLSSYFFTNLNNPNLIKDDKGNFIKLNIESLLTEDKNNNKILKKLFEASMSDVYYDIYEKDSVYFDNYYMPLYYKYEEFVGRELTDEEIEEINNQAYDLFTTKNKYGKMLENSFQDPTGVYKILKSSLTKFGLQFVETEQTDNEKENEDAPNEMDTVDTSGIKDTVFIDPRRLTATSFRILVGSLTNDLYDVNSNIVAKRNSLNLPELVDYDYTLNMLINELNGTYSRIKEENGEVVFYDALKLMFNKLDKKYYDQKSKQYKPGFVWIKKLKSRLNYAGQTESYFTKQTLDLNDIKLLVGFEKSLMNKKNNPLTLILDEDGSIYSTNALETTNEKRIREEWQNELPRNLKPIEEKSENNNQLLGIDKEGNIIFDSKSSTYKTFVKLESTKDKNIFLPSALSYLKEMGIVFTGIEFDNNNNVISSIPPVLTNKKNEIIKAFIYIKNSIINDDITNISDLFSVSGNESTNVKNLINIEKEMRFESSILTHLTASGQTQFSITLPASINYVLSSLNESETLEDFILSNPQFGTVGMKDGQKIISLFSYQRNSELLKPGGLIFDTNGNKKNNIDFNLISGISSMETNGEDTANLTYPDRVMQEINYIINADKNGLKPIYFTLINADKSSEFGLTFPKPFIEVMTSRFGIDNPNFKIVLDIYLNHLSDEIDAAIVEQKFKTNIQHYSENVKYLGHFKDVLGFKTDKELKELGINKSALQVRYEKMLSGKITKEEFLADSIIVNLIKNDLRSTVDFTIDALLDLEIIEKISDNKFITTAINKQILKDHFNIDGDNMTSDDVRALVTYITINKELAITEQHKLLYGHPALYKDLAKRAPGINSSKDGIVDNPHIIAKADIVMPRFDNKIRHAEKIQTFKNISFKDVTAVSNVYKEIAEGLYQSIRLDEINKKDAEIRIGANFNEDGTFKNFILDKKSKFTGEIKAYVELNEADGQGWIMPDMYKDMLFLSSKLTDKQIQQIDYEIAYEIKARSSKPNTDPAYKEFKKGKYTLKWAQSILEKGNPGVALPVIKPQYFGYAVNTAMMQTVFLKHSVQPKFYRSVEGSQYEKLYLAAQKNQIDIVGFESGQKVGALVDPKTGKFTSIVKEDGDINVELKNKSWDLPAGLPVQSLYTKYYGIQSEQPAVYKNKVVRGTQVTKLIMSNFKINGNYINKKSEILVNEYNKTIDEITKKGKAELLDELDITVNDKDEYVIEDYNKLVNLLRKELTRRDLPSNLVDGLNVNTETNGLMYKFDTLTNRNKIDEILNSIVNSRVISPKMFGKPSVQVASTGYNSSNRKMMYLKDGAYVEQKTDDVLTEDELKTLIPTSSDLKFYKIENGKISKMEVYVPWYFDDVSPEDLGMKLVNGVYKIPDTMDKRLLTMIGFRIPTQGMNSIENIIIKGFLPRENGDMIVVPTEIVGKSGSDFDIDKMNLYMSNYKYDYSKNNKTIIKEKYKTDEFKNFIIKFLTNFENEEGVKIYNKKNAKEILDAFSEEDLILINTSTYTEKNRKLGTALTSLESVIDDETTRYHAGNLKKGLSAYNKELKNISKELIYVESNEDSMKSLQNKLKEIMDELISQPENYRQLIMPNSTATLKSLADEINELKQKGSSEKSMLSLRKFIPSAETRERYLTGKRLVGIAALQSTSHIMSQIADIALSGNYDISKVEFLVKYDPLYEKNKDGKYEKTVTINLSYNDKEIGKFYLNAKTDAEGKWISENISEALSGFVDAAKDPFIFDLNINFNTAGTWFYLQKLGVPMREIAYLFNQPSVNKYMQLESKNKSIFKTVNGDNITRELIYINALSEYMGIIDPENIAIINQINTLSKTVEKDDIDTFSKIKKLKINILTQIINVRLETSKPSTEKLKELITNLNDPKYKITVEDAKLQIALLSDYVEYDDQASNLTTFIGAIGYDNKKTKTVIENQLQEISWNKMVDTGFIANPESILKNTFIGEMKSQKEDLFSVFKDMFISLEPKAAPVFQKLYDFLENKKIFLSAEKKSLLINKYQNFFIAYVIQNTNIKINNIETTISSMFNELMMSGNSIANQLQNLKNSPDYNISQNLAVKELIPIFSNNVLDQNNIKLFRNKMSTYKNDVLIESINNLLDYAQASGNTQLENFINNLTAFSILQSGLQDSTINFTKILPAHLYSKVINDIVNVYLNNESTIDPELVWQQFHQNNKNNRDIVKKPKYKKIDKSTGNILLDVEFGDAAYEFISASVPKKGLTKDKIDTLIENEKGTTAFDYYVYKRIGEKTETIKGVEKTFAVYMPMIPVGDGRNYTETSKYNITKSNLKKNNIVSEEGRKIGSVYEENGKPVTSSRFITNDVITEGEILTPSKAAVATNMKVIMLKPDVNESNVANGENISYNGSEFAKKLTNPGNNLKIKFRKVTFRNAEHAYQTWKSGEFDEDAFKSNEFIPRGTKKVNVAINYKLMVDIITEKLKQYPELIEGINQRGGLEYINASTHDVKGFDKFWETKSGKNAFIKALAKAYINNQPQSIKGFGFDSVSITKVKYTKELVQKNPDTAYVYTENNYSLTAFPDKVGSGTAVIRPELNAFAIVTKKKYDYNTKENVDYSNSESDFEEFKNVNTELINKIKESGKFKIVFPEGFGTGLAKMPTRFTEWLQKELLDNFGLVTELNKTEDGLISKSVTNEYEILKEKTLTLQDGNAYSLSEINDELLKDIGYTPIQKASLLSSVYSQIKTNSGKNIKDLISESEWNKLPIEEKNKIKNCN